MMLLFADVPSWSARSKQTIPSMRRKRKAAVMFALKMGEWHAVGLAQPNQPYPVPRPSAVYTRNGMARLTPLYDQLS
jgi:hypothetical protein